jgi:hypothetical protein
MTETKILDMLNEVDPRVETEKVMWEAIRAWAAVSGVSSDRLKFIQCAIKHSSGIKEHANPMMLEALKALLHPSAFVERDFLID